MGMWWHEAAAAGMQDGEHASRQGCVSAENLRRGPAAWLAGGPCRAPEPHGWAAWPVKAWGSSRHARQWAGRQEGQEGAGRCQKGWTGGLTVVA